MTAGADLRLLRAAVFTAVCVSLSAAGHALGGGGCTPPWSLAAGGALVFAVAAPLAGRERSLPGIAALLAAGQLVLHTLFALCAQRAGAMGGMPSMTSMPVGGASGRVGAGSGGAGGGLRALAGRLLCGDGTADGMSVAEARRVVRAAGLDPAQAGHAGGAPAGAAHAVGAGAGSPGEPVAHVHETADAALACLRGAARAALSLVDGPMLFGHLLAALLLGWLLRRGEAALWRLVRLSARSAARTAGAVAAPVRALRTALGWLRALCAGLLPPAAPRGGPAGPGGAERAPRSAPLQHAVHRRGPPFGPPPPSRQRAWTAGTAAAVPATPQGAAVATVRVRVRDGFGLAA